MSSTPARKIDTHPALPPRVPSARRRRWTRLGIIVATLIALVAMSGLIANEPLRRAMEARMNRSLRGYTVRIARLRLQPLGGALTLQGVEIRQAANPEPPLAVIPELRASVEWRQLLFLKLVADFAIERPRVHANLAQLRSEVSNAVPVEHRGWQEALQAIYPLKINHLRIDDAEVVYVDDDPERPLKLTHLNVRASNIRNVHSRQRAYPSTVDAEAVLFGSGRASLTGHADFLAEPHLGVLGEFKLVDIPLDDLRPIGSHWNVETRKGTISTAGQVEYAPTVRRVRIPTVLIRDVRVDYVHHSPGRAGSPLIQAAARSAQEPESPTRPWDVKVDRLQLVNADVGFTNEARDPAYRVFINAAALDVTGFSSTSSTRSAVAVLRGQFMSSGAVVARAAFRPGGRSPDLELRVAVEGTDMRRMNDLFRAHGKFDVAAGTFSLFSEIHVRDGALDGYVKPLFQNVEVYDSRQDAGKGLLRKVYESAVDVAAKVLTNHKRNQVATTVELRGPVGGPNVSTIEAIVGLIENAFFKAILPGFDRQVGLPRGARGQG